MTDFQAVDLDAVLDQFEFHEEEKEEEKKKVLENLKSSSTTTTTIATTTTIPEPNAVDSFTDLSTTTKANNEEKEEVMPKCMKNELILDQVFIFFFEV